MRFKRKVAKMGAGGREAAGQDQPHRPEASRSRREGPVLRLVVSHGDIVLQCGAQIQERYVHSIATEGLRISATARHIAPMVDEV